MVIFLNYHVLHSNLSILSQTKYIRESNHWMVQHNEALEQNQWSWS